MASADVARPVGGGGPTGGSLPAERRESYLRRQLRHRASDDDARHREALVALDEGLAEEGSRFVSSLREQQRRASERSHPGHAAEKAGLSESRRGGARPDAAEISDLDNYLITEYKHVMKEGPPPPQQSALPPARAASASPQRPVPPRPAQPAAPRRAPPPSDPDAAEDWLAAAQGRVGAEEALVRGRTTAAEDSAALTLRHDEKEARAMVRARVRADVVVGESEQRRTVDTSQLRLRDELLREAAEDRAAAAAATAQREKDAPLCTPRGTARQSPRGRQSPRDKPLRLCTDSPRGKANTNDDEMSCKSLTAADFEDEITKASLEDLRTVALAQEEQIAELEDVLKRRKQRQELMERAKDWTPAQAMDRMAQLHQQLALRDQELKAVKLLLRQHKLLPREYADGEYADSAPTTGRSHHHSNAQLSPNTDSSAPLPSARGPRPGEGATVPPLFAAAGLASASRRSFSGTPRSSARRKSHPPTRLTPTTSSPASSAPSLNDSVDLCESPRPAPSPRGVPKLPICGDDDPEAVMAGSLRVEDLVRIRDTDQDHIEQLRQERALRRNKYFARVASYDDVGGLLKLVPGIDVAALLAPMGPGSPTGDGTLKEQLRQEQVARANKMFAKSASLDCLGKLAANVDWAALGVGVQVPLAASPKRAVASARPAGAAAAPPPAAAPKRTPSSSSISSSSTGGYRTAGRGDTADPGAVPNLSSGGGGDLTDETQGEDGTASPRGGRPKGLYGPGT